VDVEQVRQAATAFRSEVSARLFQIPGAIADRVRGTRDTAEAHAILRDEIVLALQELSGSPAE
jgi:hypothetical protein